MGIFDIALEKRFDESTEIDYVDLDDADSFLIKDVPSGLIMKLTVSDLKAFFTSSLSGDFATLVSGKVPDDQLPDSGHIAEGTNLYYTNTRARGAVSASDSLSYNSSTGVFSYSTPSSLPASDVYTWAKAAVKPSYTKTEVGLSNVDNTADSAKPVSTAQATAIALKADIAQAAWTTPTLAGAWANLGAPYETAGYIKDTLGFVHLKGLVASGSGTIFTLAAGYRPANTKIFPTIANGTLGDIRINSAGEVLLYSGSSGYVSLDGITFKP